MTHRAFTHLGLAALVGSCIWSSAFEARAGDIATVTAGPDLPGASSQALVVAGADGLFYIFGGFDAVGVVVNTVRSFDPVSGNYALRASMPTATRGACGSLMPDGRIVVVGGFASGEIDVVQVYTPSTNTWAAGTSTPSGWECAAVTGADGRLHLVGGESAPQTQHRSYDVVTNTWMDHASLPTARATHGAGIGPDGKIYVFGGHLGGGGQTMDVWDPVSNTWSAGPALATVSVQSAFASSGPSIYVLGGSTTNGNDTAPYFNTIQIFDTVSNTWATSATVLATGIRESNAAINGGALHMFGGSTGSPTVIHQVGALDSDSDGDGIDDPTDNCPSIANVGQADADGDGAGDACDVCPNDASDDFDGDTICGDVDNCPAIDNMNQANADGDALGDACDGCEDDADNDIDDDNVCGDIDNCPAVANADQADADDDGVGDACDMPGEGGAAQGGGNQGGAPVEGGSGQGATSEGGASASGGEAAGGAGSDSSEDDGCGCKIVDSGNDARGLALLALGLVGVFTRRKRSR